MEILTLGFSLEPGITESEIATLWQQTQAAQQALDRFLAGEFTEGELTDLLSLYDVDIEGTAQALESNAETFGLIKI